MVAQGRSVVLVGDLNIAPHMLDHCDWCGKASQSSAQSQFLQHRPDRQWFQSTLTMGGGPLSDVFRKFHLDRSAQISFCICFCKNNAKQCSKCLHSVCMLKGRHVHKCCMTGNAVLPQGWYLAGSALALACQLALMCLVCLASTGSSRQASVQMGCVRKPAYLVKQSSCVQLLSYFDSSMA